MTALANVDACVGPVNDFAEAVDDPQLRHRAMVVEQPDWDGTGRPQVATPIKLLTNPASLRQPAAALGADTRRYLTELGYSSEDVAALVKSGVVAEARNTAQQRGGA